MSVAPGGRDAAGWQPFELDRGAAGLFTGRPGGVSSPPYSTLNLSAAVADDPAAVRRNRELVAAACGLTVTDLAWMRQVHGADVTKITAGHPGQAAPRCDAIFTDAPRTALVVLVADCAPVLLADPAAGLVGAAHAGREGLAAGVVPALVTAMSAAGADPGRMRAVVGPAICGGCYAVPGELRDRVAAAVPEAFCVTAAGTPGLDIRAGVHAQLARAGVGTIGDDPRCTAQTAELFSYRRDGRTGRSAGLVWLAT